MKRLSIPIHEHSAVADEVALHVQPWRELYHDKRTFHYYFGNTILSVKQDIAREGLEMLRRFHAVSLPLYEPEYLWVNRDPIAPNELITINDIEVTNISDFDKFFTNTFNALELSKTHELSVSEKLISGAALDINTLRLVTEDGDLLTYDLVSGLETSFTTAPFKVGASLQKKVHDTRFCFIPGAIKISSVVDQAGNNITKYTVQEITRTDEYQNAYDVNANGIIDDEDLAEFQNVEGLTFEKADPHEWNLKYRTMDANGDGSIGQFELNTIQRLLFVAFEKGTLILLPTAIPAFTVTYVSIPEPQIGQIHKVENSVFTVNTNTLGSSILLSDIEKQPGIYASTYLSISDTFIEIDQNKNVNFAKVENLNAYKVKVSWSQAYEYNALALTSIDDIVLLLTRSISTGKYRVYGFDASREAVESTDSFYDIDVTGEVTFICTLANPDILLVCARTDEGKNVLYTFNLIRKYSFLESNTRTLYLSKNVSVTATATTPVGTLGSEIVIPPREIVLVPRKVQNSVDDYGYNWGLKRIPGETNIQYRDRILDFWKHLQGNDKRGMLYGIGRELGIPPSQIETIRPHEKFTVSLKGVYTGFYPVRILIVDDVLRKLYLYAFTKYEDFSEPGTFNLKLKNLIIPSGATIDLPDEFSNYSTEFDKSTFSKNSMSVVTDSNGNIPVIGSWNISGNTISENDSIEIFNGAMSFELCPYIVNKHRGQRALIFYDTVDAVNNLHASNFDDLVLPNFVYLVDEQKHKVIIEDLLHAGKYRDRWINDLTKRDELISAFREKDNSKWDKTIGDISFFDSGVQSGELLKENQWTALSFNKHFSESTNASWRL